MDYEAEVRDGADENSAELISISQAADRLGVSSRTFYRYLDKYRSEVDEHVIDDGTLKLTPEGVSFFREALKRRDNRGRKRKNKPKPSREDSRLSGEDRERSRPRDAAEQRLRRRDQESGLLEKELEITKRQIDVLDAQILDLKEQRGRLIAECNGYRDENRRLQEERDRLLFEVAEWRGLYGRIEDQRALVVVDQKDNFFSRIWRSFSTKK